LDDTSASETFSVLSYNVLCDKYCTTAQYGYTPSEVLSWDYRKKVILDEVKDHDADIVCLQEVDMESYNEFFRRELAYNDYRGVFWPKSRAKTMAEKEAKLVDGCATFFKASKYICLDKQLIDFANTAINRPDMKGEHDIFNRVMPRDNIAVATFLENRLTGSRLIVVNAHIFWDPAFKDVKLVQVAILVEQVSALADKWTKHAPCTEKSTFRHAEGDGEAKAETVSDEPPMELGPSVEYSSGNQIPLLICGDFNSSSGSGVHDLLTFGSVAGSHSDLANRGYGNFTRDGMAHGFSLKSAYSGTDELSFTNYTPNFTGILDYIWYSTNTLQIRGLLGNVDQDYLRKVPGFPNHHFPSDHLALRAELSIKSRKERKAVEVDFGPQRERRN
jgi:CCR4-NOT transcription complex subunit 6